MGTNFYLRHHLSKEDKTKVSELLDQDKYTEAERILDTCKEIHIGKRSGGWRFLWDANYFHYFEPTKESLIEWLKSGTIYDEYGEIFSFEQFWNEEIKNFLTNGYDLEAYVKANQTENTYYGDLKYHREWYKSQYGVDVNWYGEFYIDGLRFTMNTNFS